MHIVTTPHGLVWRPSLARRLLAMLRFMGPAGADMAQLVEIAYGDDPAGGPLDPRDAISATLCRLRREGHAITRNRHGRRGGFVLS